MATIELSDTQVSNIVAQVLRTLRGRSGFDHVLDEVLQDEELRAELVRDLEDNVRVATG